ncbi:MAG: SUMF1/EgtB/PvdO family nonheme iron enzyme [Saprospiraceae bacterium]|nr:SUMF1/EgtB/PvdO family nonheme iron enzyme [Saprospiraceae bacterium]
MKTLFSLWLCIIAALPALSPALPAFMPRAGQDYALLFAVNDYRSDKLTDLTNPIKNAEDIAEELETRYGFDAEVIPNPTYDDIDKKIKEYENHFARNIDGRYPENGQLLIFFSGHGSERFNVGYFLPSDADPDNLARTALDYNFWRNRIDAINCNHILVAIDACHSATFDPDWAWANRHDRHFSRPGELTEKEKVILNHSKYKSRFFFTSDGKGDQTPDRSSFANKILEGLRTHSSPNGFLTSSQLFASYIENAFPMPRGGDFGASEGGASFLFFHEAQGPAVDTKTTEQRRRDLNAWEKAQSTGTIAAYQEYLDNNPGGGFRPEALAAINALQDDDEWRYAKAKNTPEAYREYLRLFPKGRHATEAKNAIDNAGAALQSNTTDATPDIAALDRFVKIEGSTFQMGDIMGDNENINETLHPVTVSTFYLSPYEVTFEEYDRYCEAAGKEKPSDSGRGRGKRPVINVNWYETVEYCNWRSQQAKLKPVYTINGINVSADWSANGYRLPTEAEWEFAARAVNGKGGGKVRFGNGKDIADPKEIIFYAKENAKKSYSVVGENRSQMTSVGSFLPNSLGLYDMSGSVWEWCWDWYNIYTYSLQINPKGPYSDSRRVCRGGSWLSYPALARCASRLSFTPDYRSLDLGIRLARAAR